LDTRNKAQVRRFVRIPYRLYANHPQWVPPLFGDVELLLNRDKHPYYEFASADFFIVVSDGRDVGRIGAAGESHSTSTQDASSVVLSL